MGWSTHKLSDPCNAIFRNCNCWLIAECPNNMLVCLGDRSAQTIVCAATLRQKLQIKLSISPSHSILTLRKPVPALTLQHQMPGSVACGVPIFRSLVQLSWEKDTELKQESNPGLLLSRHDAFPLGQWCSTFRGSWRQ